MDDADRLHRRPAKEGRAESVWEPLANWRSTSWWLAVAATTTGAYAILFALLRPALSAPFANVAALLITTAINTAAHRRLTFRVVGPQRRIRAQVGGLVGLGLSLVISTALLAVLEIFDDPPSTTVALGALLLAAAIASWLRFGLLRNWIGGAAMRSPELKKMPDPAPQSAELAGRAHRRQPVAEHSRSR